MDKLKSGRFWFTLITGVVFFNLAINGLLPPEKVYQIIMLVLVFYFNRPDRGKTV